jgi:Domain of unknown function (DUF4129)
MTMPWSSFEFVCVSRPLRWQCALCAITLIAMWFSGGLALAYEGEEAVAAGADALDSWTNYPWYDSANDSVRPVRLRSPRPVTQSAPTMPRGGGGTWNWDWLGWTLIGLLVLLIVALAVKFFLDRDKRRSQSTAAGRIVPPASVDRLEELPFELEEPVHDPWTAARAAADRGDYNRAIILLYSHQLLELDRVQIIHLAKGKTNRQYLREVRSRPGLAAMLGTTMVAFEDVFFGGHDLARARFEECWRLTQELVGLSQEREAA